MDANAASEALEHRLPLSSRDPRSRVVDDHRPRAHSHQNWALTVEERIFDKVAERSLESGLIANIRCCLAVQIDYRRWMPRVRTRHQIGHQIVQQQGFGLFDRPSPTREIDGARDHLRYLIDLAVQRSSDLLAVQIGKRTVGIAQRLDIRPQRS